MVVKIEKTSEAEALFAGWQETMIWSCLQGIMGRIYGNFPESPTTAMAVLGDFSFLAGEPKEELLLYRPEECKTEFRILVPQTEAWEACIERELGRRVKKVTRYAFCKDPKAFDREKLSRMAEALPSEYSIRKMDQELYEWCRGQEWCRDWVSQYPDYAAYEKYGLGVVITKDGIPVSGASSYSGYQGGIEIEIDTREDYRRRGLARVCGARLILECLDRKIYPSWDAQNLWSAALAGQLGYRMERAYTAYVFLNAPAMEVNPEPV